MVAPVASPKVKRSLARVSESALTHRDSPGSGLLHGLCLGPGQTEDVTETTAWLRPVRFNLTKTRFEGFRIPGYADSASPFSSRMEDVNSSVGIPSFCMPCGKGVMGSINAETAGITRILVRQLRSMTGRGPQTLRNSSAYNLSTARQIGQCWTGGRAVGASKDRIVVLIPILRQWYVGTQPSL